MRTPLRGAAAYLATTVLAVVAGCGGGGGGATVVYKGVETPAVVSVADADTLTASVVTAQEFNFPALASFAKPGSGATASGVPAGFDPARVHRAMGAAVGALGKAGDAARYSAKFTQACPSGGSAVFEVPDLLATTGIFKETFFQCDLGDGFLINGSVIDNVTVATATQDAGTVYMNLSMSFSGQAFQFSAQSTYDLNSATLVDHTTGDFEFWDSVNDVGMRIEDMDATDTYADVSDWDADCALTSDYTMTVYDAVFGMVQMATTTPVAFTVNACVNPGPSSGGPIVITGDGGGTITLTPLSTTQATFAVDVDGDTVAEATSTELWVDLGFI